MPYCDTGIHFRLHHTQADRPHKKSTYLRVAMRESLSRLETWTYMLRCVYEIVVAKRCIYNRPDVVLDYNGRLHEHIAKS